MPDGARLAVRGSRTRAHISSPTAKTPNTTMDIVPASMGTTDAAASSHERTQIDPTTPGSDGVARLAVRFTAAICSTTMRGS
jgi:hypothetical protein